MQDDAMTERAPENTSSNRRSEPNARVRAVEGTDRPLRVLRVSTDTYPELIGGGAIHAHELSRMQAEMGHSVTLLTSDHGDHHSPDRERRAGYDLRRYREFARPFGNSITPGMIPALSRLAASHDVVHAHSHLYFSSNLAAVVARVSDTPLVVTNHGLYSQSAPKAVQNAFLRSVGRFTFESADRVLTYSEPERSELRSLGVSAPISVVHNGVDCERFAPAAGEPGGSQVLFVGRLKETKGVHRLVEAVAGLVGKVPDVSLKVVGEGPQREELGDLVGRLGIEDRVTFTGRLPNDELAEVYAESTVFALPSTAEGFPRTVLEAMACGTPVVSSDLPQLEPVVGEVGATVPAEDAAALESALRAFLTDETRRSASARAGRQLVYERYSWAETVAKTTRIYYELLV